MSMPLLKDSFVFQTMDSAANLKTKMSQYSPALDNISKQALQDPMKDIQRRFNFSTKNKVISDLKTDNIVPIFNKERIKLPSSVPAYLYNQGGRPVALVNLSNHFTKPLDAEEINGDPRQLFALLQSGTLLLGCYYRWNTIIANQEICKTGALVYAKCFAKVIDRLYATNLDPYKSDKVRFIAARFFLTRMLGKPYSDTVLNQAFSVCKTMTYNNIGAFSHSLPESSFSSLDKMLQLISEQIDGCSSLCPRIFFQAWHSMYQPSTMLAIDYAPYFFHMLFCVSVGAHMNNEMVLDSLLGKDIDKLYNAVSNIIR